MAQFTDLAGQRILVTGASSGLGRGIAEFLARQGARVVLAGRDTAKLEEVRASLTAGDHLAEAFDLNATEQIPEWMRTLIVRGGPFHGLVHSAGILTTKPLKLLTAADWEASLRINVVAGGMLAKAFRVRGVNAGSGSIVFLSSVMGLTGQPGQILYSATKGALIAMTRSMALELARENIRVNCVAPAVVVAGMSASLEKNVGPEGFAAITAQHPLGLGQPEDVATAVAFLLSESARWITGTTLTVDGGYTAH